MKIDARNWLVEIPVIKDLPLFQKVVTTVYKERGANCGAFLKIPQFEGEELCLDTSSDPSTGWTVTPLVTPPKLLRRDIDSYIKGATIPTFQLEYDWIRDSVPERLKHSVEFKPTGWGMNVSINPGSSTLLQHQAVSPMSGTIPSTSPVELGETDAFEVYAQLQPVAERWRFLGLALGLPGNALSTIGAKQATADEYLLDVILQLLKNNKLTWEKIVDAVKNPAGGNNTALASNISKDKIRRP